MVYNSVNKKGVTRAKRDIGVIPGTLPANILKSETFTAGAVEVFCFCCSDFEKLRKERDTPNEALSRIC
jgi:hypothetical protein